jgi:hypothetical protein
MIGAANIGAANIERGTGDGASEFDQERTLKRNLPASERAGLLEQAHVSEASAHSMMCIYKMSAATLRRLSDYCNIPW